ncbi:aerobic respiration control sensor protein ArcB [Vibrio thalassae]|uniref:Aerobic respiration control sensor protein ArcB n=1 Tax=Vibrio thalassae TaxID=1243014 RepID=A0A240ELV7_9VIBR|nr:PAS domain-containing protein [Vibrio thalassae]SNX49677.1 aerobic respiration control sensor protein ArcB [Vibrio thalassae]
MLFFIKDKQGCYTYVNEAVCRLFGRDREEIIGFDDSQFFTVEEVCDLIKNDQSVLTGNTVSNIEVNTLKSGEVKHYQNMKSPIFNSHNEVVGIFGLAIDIS